MGAAPSHSLCVPKEWQEDRGRSRAEVGTAGCITECKEPGKMRGRSVAVLTGTFVDAPAATGTRSEIRTRDNPLLRPSAVDGSCLHRSGQGATRHSKE